jgi:hypothetical protein
MRQQAESLVAEAQKRAALVKIRQQPAEAQAEVAVHEARKMIYYGGISGQTFGEALGGRDKFVDAAQQARAAAEAEARKAEQARVVADAITAKANAAEAKLEKERLARVVNK